MSTNKIHKRHAISDSIWAKLASLLSGHQGVGGRPAKDKRRFINAVFWIVSTGVPWRALPPDYGDWKHTHRCFSRWREQGRWKNILEALIDEPDFQWLMIDTTHITLHPDGASAKDANQAMGRTKGKAPSGRGYAHGMPLRAIITQDTVADCQKAATLMAGFTAA